MRRSGWITSSLNSQVLFHRHNVDDTFCLFHTEIMHFCSTIQNTSSNIRCPNIHFKMEREVEKKSAFLDIVRQQTLIPSITPETVFQTKTFTDVLTNYFTVALLSYKLGLVKTLMDSAYKINNTWIGFHGDINKLTFILQTNCFPIWTIDKIIHSYVSKKRCQSCKLRGISSPVIIKSHVLAIMLASLVRPLATVHVLVHMSMCTLCWTRIWRGSYKSILMMRD